MHMSLHSFSFSPISHCHTDSDLDRPKSRIVRFAWFLLLFVGFYGVTEKDLAAQTLIPGFSQTVVPGPTAGEWNEAVGIRFESNGRMWVWERGGRVWIKDTSDTTPVLLLNISEEVGAWDDHGFLGFAIDPHFRQNGYIYLLYVVDRHY